MAIIQELHDRREAKRLLHSRYAIAILALIAIVIANAVWGVYRKYERSKGLEDRMKAEMEALEARQAVLVRSVEALKTDAGKEREIRDRFGAVREGEKLVVLVGDAVPSAGSVPAPEPGLWKRFWTMLGF